MRTAPTILYAMVLSLAACGNDRQEAQQTQGVESTTSTAVETAEAPSSETTTTKQGTQGAAPSAGQQATSCPAGVSIDPSATELGPPSGQTSTAPQARLNHLRYLITRYPQSATIRVKAAGMQLGPAPAGNPVESQRLYREALQLHDSGCRLTEGLEWEAIEGTGLASMMQTNYAAALPIFQQVTTRWPTIPQSRYNLACAYCRLNQLEPCHQAFVEALQIAHAGQFPAFITRQTGAFHYVNLARQDPDLAILRADPRFETAIQPYVLQQ